MKHLNRKKTVLLLAMVVLILAGAVGGTLAYIVTSSGPVQNTFTPAHVTCAVEEDFSDNTIKKDVKIRNTGNTSAYIRAAIVANWVDKDGKIIQSVSAEHLGIKCLNGWELKGDGYYYYPTAVEPGEATAVKFTNYTAPTDKPTGAYRFEMTIVCQAIQSEGGAVTFNNGMWSISKPGN